MVFNHKLMFIFLVFNLKYNFNHMCRIFVEQVDA
jgi:hypothetical protein